MHLARRIPVCRRVTKTKSYNAAVASIPPRSTGHGRRLARRRSTRLSTEPRTFLKKRRLRDGVKTGVVRALKKRFVSSGMGAHIYGRVESRWHVSGESYGHDEMHMRTGQPAKTHAQDTVRRNPIPSDMRAPAHPIYY
jgi:hypothetical protein